MKIDYANLNYQYLLYQDEIDAAIQEVLNSSRYILGPQNQKLEKELAAFTGASYCIVCSSGTDALQLALMSLGIGPGHEVITTPFTFISTAGMIAHLGALPVFADIDQETYNIDPNLIEQAITEKTRAILPVSLYGQPADMQEINDVAGRYQLPVIEDAAQSFGATYHNRSSCNLSQLGCTSFFPAKPLGCYGDGGAVFTSQEDLAQIIECLRVHGQNERYQHKYLGLAARMDTIQAAVLLTKLRHYPEEIKMRQEVASIYNELLRDLVITPALKNDRTSIWSQYSIRVKDRDQVKAGLQQAGIPTAVHYPLPLHLQQCFAYLGYKRGDFPRAEAISNEILSLPMNPFLSREEQEYIALNLRKICRARLQ